MCAKLSFKIEKEKKICNIYKSLKLENIFFRSFLMIMG